MHGCRSRHCFSYRRSMNILSFEGSIKVPKASVPLRAFLARAGAQSTASQAARGARALLKGGGACGCVDGPEPLPALRSRVDVPRIGPANRNIGIPQCWVSDCH